MTALKGLVIVGVTLGISTGPAPHARAQTASSVLPPDVVEFIGRRDGCVEWSMKAFDPEWKARIESIVSNMQSLKCADITDDEHTLRQKYANDPEIVASLRPRWVKVITRLPVRIAVPPALDR